MEYFAKGDDMSEEEYGRNWKLKSIDYDDEAEPVVYMSGIQTGHGQFSSYAYLRTLDVSRFQKKYQPQLKDAIAKLSKPMKNPTFLRILEFTFYSESDGTPMVYYELNGVRYPIDLSYISKEFIDDINYMRKMSNINSHPRNNPFDQMDGLVSININKVDSFTSKVTLTWGEGSVEGPLQRVALRLIDEFHKGLKYRIYNPKKYKTSKVLAKLTKLHLPSKKQILKKPVSPWFVLSNH